MFNRIMKKWFGSAEFAGQPRQLLLVPGPAGWARRPPRSCSSSHVRAEKGSGASGEPRAAEPLLDLDPGLRAVLMCL